MTQPQHDSNGTAPGGSVFKTAALNHSATCPTPAAASLSAASAGKVTTSAPSRESQRVAAGREPSQPPTTNPTTSGPTLAAAAQHDRFQLRFLGDAVLTTPCTLVGSVAEIPADLLPAMRRVISEHNAVGLAANQVGAALRVIVVRIAGDLVAMVNPRITSYPGVVEWMTEGCLSVPGFQASVRRHTAVVVEYRAAEDFAPALLHLNGLSAQAVQHEVDHLDGRLIVDALSRQQRRQAERLAAKAVRS